MRHTSCLIALLSAALCACGGKTVPAPRPMGAVPVEARLFYDNGGGIRDSSAVVIRDVATLQRYWTQVTSTQSAPPPVPTIDFGRQMAVLVAAGRMQPDNQLRVDSAGIREERTADGKEKDVLSVHYTITVGCRNIS